METLGVCTYMGGGPALMYAAEAVRAYEEMLPQAGERSGGARLRPPCRSRCAGGAATRSLRVSTPGKTVHFPEKPL